MATFHTTTDLALQLFPELTKKQAQAVYLSSILGATNAANVIGVSQKSIYTLLYQAKNKFDLSTFQELKLINVNRLIAILITK